MSAPAVAPGDHPPLEWNDTARPFRSDATIHQLVREAAAAHPDRPALVGADGQVIRYAELDGWSDRFARLLAQLDSGPGSFVALYSDRTPLACAALLGILKAGASYVPLDPAWPARRTRELLTDLGVGCLVTGRAHLRAVQELRWEVPSLRHVVCLDIAARRTWEEALDRDAVADFFDLLAGEPDPLVAAGFNVRRSARPYTPADVAAYQSHVACLATDTVGNDAAILEIGCGSGLVTAGLAGRSRRYVAVDPSSVAVDRNAAEAAARGIGLDTAVLYAHEVAGRVPGPFDLVVMASTVQFLPDLEYLLDTLASLVPLIAPGGAVLLADLIDPALEHHAGVRVPPALLEQLPELVPGITGVEVRRRSPEGFAGELALRYDAVIRVTPAAVTARAERAGRVWTGAHVADQPADPLPEAATADDIAYAIFTSGSTGPPKAVLVQHRSVVNLVDWMNRTYAVRPDDRILFVASFCFDLSVYDIFGLLAAGGSIRVCAEAELAEPESIVDILEAEPVTIWDSAPAALAMVTPFLQARDPRGREHLRLVLLSGDWIPVPLPDEIRAQFPRASVVALGGATECTVWSNHYPVGVVDPAWPSIPYGRPGQNARYHVLDEDLRPCPVGVDGDLFIAGDFVAVGYAGSPHLTAAKFQPDPWARRPGERMYRTGDRARWLPSGDLEFLGRLDDQLKVRGFRIELGEVRAALAQCPGVRAAVVLALDTPAGKDLAGFYVPAAPDRPDADEVRAFLATILPAYMIPPKILRLSALPVGPTGKVDREALRRLV